MKHVTQESGRFNRLARWLFAWPFRKLPSAFGNPVPSDLQVFEDQAAEAQQRSRPDAAVQSMRHQHSTPAVQDESLERQ